MIAGSRARRRRLSSRKLRLPSPYQGEENPNSPPEKRQAIKPAFFIRERNFEEDSKQR